MNRDELEHAIRAACDVSEDEEIWIFGSQAILGEHPDAPRALRHSAEVDVAPRNFPERVERIDGSCLEAHDLAASKLVAFREKDRTFARVLIVEDLVSSELLLERVRALPADEDQIERLLRWVEATAMGANDTG